MPNSGKKSNNVIAMNLSPPAAESMVQEIAEDSGRVFFTNHAEEKMAERDITRTQVVRCLEHGRIIEGPSRDLKGNWRMTMECLSAGSAVTVVVALDNDGDDNIALIVTTY